MTDSARSMDVLKKILNSKPTPTGVEHSSEKLIEDYLLPKEDEVTVAKRSPGRPPVEEHLKAKNFTLCLAPKYLRFLDQMKVKDKKVQGRGRKIRFIIDQFVELHRRQKSQLTVLSEALKLVEEVLKGFSGQVRKGQKLSLTNKEKAQISRAVDQIQVLLRILKFTPKELHRLLPKDQWSVLSFCLDWSQKQGSVK